MRRAVPDPSGGAVVENRMVNPRSPLRSTDFEGGKGFCTHKAVHKQGHTQDVRYIAYNKNPDNTTFRSVKHHTERIADWRHENLAK